MPPYLDREIETNLEEAKNVGSFGCSSGNCGTDESETEQTEEERLSEQVFSIPLILKQILTDLDMEDLLGTSLVNKNWNFFSREVLRQNEKCIAIVEKLNFCQDLHKLFNLLQNSDNVPFNGISLAVPGIYDPNHQCKIIHGDLSEIMSIILRKITIKYLGLEFGRLINSNCIGLKFIQGIILKKARSLEELHLNVSRDVLMYKLSDYIGLDLQGHWLPNLRILEFPFVFSGGKNGPLRMIKELIEAAPKLQKLFGNVDTECLKFIVPLKASRTVKDFDFIPKINFLEYFADFCKGNPRLEGLSFSTRRYKGGIGFCDWREFHQNEVSRVLKQLLKSSQDSLETFTCDHPDLILMTFQWNVPVLKKLNHLRLGYDPYVDQFEGYSTLRKIDWAKYFPNLKEVWVMAEFLQHLSRDFYIGETFRQSNALFVCESVKIFRWMWSDAGTMQMFKSIFPNVEEFYIKCLRDREFPSFLNELWTGWQDLKLVVAAVCILEPICNCDSDFLGVTEEEVTYLLENIEDLGSLEIVSTRPCIFNLRKLKKFQIEVTHYEELRSEARSILDTVFFTRVTEQCVFSRVAGLQVEIRPCLCHICTKSFQEWADIRV